MTATKSGVKKRSSTRRPKAHKSEKPASDQPAGIRLTHPDRVIFKEQGITKRDLAAYYTDIADWILPHVAGRPLAMLRCPDGSGGKCFFQKHPPTGLPDVVERISIQEKNEVDTYLVVNDVQGLVALVQFGVLEIHTWGSRTEDIERPDRLIFDLDPDPAVAWRDVIKAAVEMRKLLGTIELESFVKTSGGKGLHVVVPVAPKYDWAEVKPFCRAIAEYFATAHPDRYIAKSSKSARTGRIFVDYLRNDRGATAVAPYSPRARAGAPVAMPVTWNELSRISGPAHFTLENTLPRLHRLRRDPWADLSKTHQSIPFDRLRDL